MPTAPVLLLSSLFSAFAAPHQASGRIVPVAEAGNAAHAAFEFSTREDTRSAPWVCIGVPEDWVIRRATYEVQFSAKRSVVGEARHDPEREESVQIQNPTASWSCYDGPRGRYRLDARGHFGLRLYIPRGVEGQAEVHWQTPGGSAVTKTVEVFKGLAPRGRGLPVPPAYEERPGDLDRILRALNEAEQLLDRVDQLDQADDFPAALSPLLRDLGQAPDAFDRTTRGIPMELGFYTAISDSRHAAADVLLSQRITERLQQHIEAIDSLLASADEGAHRKAGLLAEELEQIAALTAERLLPSTHDAILAATISAAERLGQADALIKRTTRCFQVCRDRETLGLAYGARARQDLWNGKRDTASAWCRTGQKRLDGSGSQAALIGACDALFEGDTWQQ